MDTRIIMWVHPLLQVVATVVGLVAMYWGIRRFQMTHLHHKIVFPWKRHVVWGTLALVLWLLGPVTGLYFAHIGWGSMFVTDIHYVLAFALVPLCLLGYGTGYVLDRHKKRRTVLNVVHGVNNLLLCIVVCVQVVTGVWVIRTFMTY